MGLYVWEASYHNGPCISNTFPLNQLHHSKWPMRFREVSWLAVFALTSAYLALGNGMIAPDSKVHEANTGPIWGRQDPGGPYVGHMNFAIRDSKIKDTWWWGRQGHVYLNLPVFLLFHVCQYCYCKTWSKHGRQILEMIKIIYWLRLAVRPLKFIGVCMCVWVRKWIWIYIYIHIYILLSRRFNV